MTSWHGLMRAGQGPAEWPYPIGYDRVNELDTDVLILGGGIAGCHAAMSAARRGVRVAVLDKGAVSRSGNGGAGVDHWAGACTNPASGVSPVDFAEAALRANTYECGIPRIIKAMESWPALLDCEEAGLQLRDVDDEFKGASFRDEETKLLFAYNYEARDTVRVRGGHEMKPLLARQLKRLGVQVLNRVQATGLLTEGGRQGARVIGATGVNTRTGEFYVVRAGATIIAMARASRLWLFSSELYGSATAFSSFSNSGDGWAMGWRAGAELGFMTSNNAGFEESPFNYIPYGVGNCDNTWHGCSVVDDKGVGVPWLDRDGRVLESEAQRFLPAEGQELMLNVGVTGWPNYETGWPQIPADMAERVRDGRLQLPLYADLPGMSAHERRAIFGLMVGNEGRTRVPVYDTYTKAGFDPDRDMLMLPVMPPESYDSGGCYWLSQPVPQPMAIFGGGFVIDWDLKTSLDGLYAAGESTISEGCHSNAAATGRYAGRHAAEYAKSADKATPDEKQIEAEKRRVYAGVERPGAGHGWNELNAGLARIMQDLCGHSRSENTLTLGLEVLGQYREHELQQGVAANPHELGGLLEVESLATVGEIVMRAALEHRASSEELGHYRLDHPQMDPPEYQKVLPIHDEGGTAVFRDLPLDYYRRAPYADSLEENYKAHCGLEEGER